MFARSVSLALATLAAVAAWLTLGLQAVIDDSTRARVGVLPPWWMLGALALAFVGVTWLDPGRGPQVITHAILVMIEHPVALL